MSFQLSTELHFQHGSHSCNEEVQAPGTPFIEHDSACFIRTAPLMMFAPAERPASGTHQHRTLCCEGAEDRKTSDFGIK